MRVDELDFPLPRDLIAQNPAEKRDECRLLVYSRAEDKQEHTVFKNILQYIHKDDILIFNNTRVFAARLSGIKKDTGARVELLLLEKIDKKRWKALIKPAKRIKKGTMIILDGQIKVIPVESLGEGRFLIEFEKEMDFPDVDSIGEIPLPPYIKRASNKRIDGRYYQTVYAKEYGAVAAPTAGFHFSDELIIQLKEKGVRMGYITLHISYATFAPIRSENVEDHVMHSEHLIIPDETVALINNNKKGRILAVGTTVVRGLESTAVSKKRIGTYNGSVTTYIIPPYEPKIVDGLITNFHLTKSTLLLLVSAFTGLDKLKQLYKEAIEKKYRFFSYGDAMMII